VQADTGKLRAADWRCGDAHSNPTAAISQIILVSDSEHKHRREGIQPNKTAACVPGRGKMDSPEKKCGIATSITLAKAHACCLAMARMSMRRFVVVRCLKSGNADNPELADSMSVWPGPTSTQAPPGQDQAP